MSRKPRQQLVSRIAYFDERDTPYLPRIKPYRADMPGDYDHLARVREWSLAGWERTNERDPHDPRAASDPTRSAWVSANAGAGKTYTLANRVTRLLLASAKPERILCLTYTKAAAAEMAGRLFEQLGQWSMADDAEAASKRIVGDRRADRATPKVLREARRLFAQALETPGGLKIQTIHAFCQYLLARFPLEAGVPPSFRVLDDQTARELRDEARQRVLERAGSGDDALAKAAAHLVTACERSAAAADPRRRARRRPPQIRALSVVFAGKRRCHGAGRAPCAWRTRRRHLRNRRRRNFRAAMKTEEPRFREIVSWLSGGTKTDSKRAELLLRAIETGAFDEFQRKPFSPARRTAALQSLATKKLVETRPELLAISNPSAERVSSLPRNVVAPPMPHRWPKRR